MSEDAEIRKIQEALERIERGMFGEAKTGHLGLVTRMNNHAKRIGALERLRIYYVAAAVGAGGSIGLLYKVATDWWPHR